MLIYSEQRLVPTDVNMLVIRGKEEGYFYIHRSLYDQAVIINDIYKDTPELLRKAITGSEDTRDDVELFMSNAPSPINMLGPYLLLVKEQLEDFVDMVGAIHVMSGPRYVALPYRDAEQSVVLSVNQRRVRAGMEQVLHDYYAVRRTTVRCSCHSADERHSNRDSPYWRR